MHPIIFTSHMVKAILSGRKTQTRRILTERNSRSTVKLCELNFNDVVVDSFLTGGTDRYLKVHRPSDDTRHRVFNKWQTEDILYVRENWKLKSWDFEDGEAIFQYSDGSQETQLFDDTNDNGSAWLVDQINKLELMGILQMVPAGDNDGARFKFSKKPHPFSPSIHLPKWASRIFLKIKCIRIERLQDISKEDAIAEGIEVVRNNGRGFIDYRYYNDRSNAESITNPIESYRSLWELINGPASWEQNPWVWVIEFEQTEKPSLNVSKGTV